MHLTGLLVPDIAEERTSELEDISTETFKAEKQREQRQKENNKTKQNIQRLWDTCEKRSTGIMRIPEWEEREEQKKYLNP